MKPPAPQPESEARPNPRAKRRLLILAGFAVPVGLLGAFLSYRKPWVIPRDDVDLTPAVPMVNIDEIVPGSGTDLFQRADFSMGAFLDFDLRPEAFRHGWPPPGREDAAQEILSRWESAAGLLQAALDDPASVAPSYALVDLAPVHSGPPFTIPDMAAVVMYAYAAADDWDAATRALHLGLTANAIMQRGPAEIHSTAPNAQSLRWTIRAVADHHDLPDDVRTTWIRRLVQAAGEVPSPAEAARQSAWYWSTRLASARTLPLSFREYRSPRLFRRKSYWVWPQWILSLRGSSPHSVSRNLQQIMKHVVAHLENPDDPGAAAFFARMEQMGSAWDVVTADDPIGLQIGLRAPSIAAQLRENSEIGILAYLSLVAELTVQGHVRAHGTPPSDLSSLDTSFLDPAPASVREAWTWLEIVPGRGETWVVRVNPFIRPASDPPPHDPFALP